MKRPDIVTMAKPLANGIPIGAIMVRDEVVQAVTVGQSLPSLVLHLLSKLTGSTTGSHGTTFGGNVLSTRLAHHVLSRLSTPAFLTNLSKTSAQLNQALSRFPQLFPELIAADPRGRGLILGLPFHHASMPGRFVELCRERGVLLLTAGTDCVRLLPSLNVTKEECERAVEVMESVGVVMLEEGWSKDGKKA